jgi:hypothetical protein
MDKDTALDLALEALEYFSDTSPTMAGKAHAEDAITAIKQARSAPVQEPVTIPDCGEAGHADGACGNRECLPSFRRAAALAANRQWTGLTDEEIEHLWETRVSQPCPRYPLEKADWVQFARAIEAKLKENT